MSDGTDYVKMAKSTAWDFLSAFRTPRFMDVVDLRLGVANRSLQGAIFVYFIILMVTFKEYELKYVPEGSSQYYMSSGTMYTDQESAATTAMCTAAAAGTYDYTDPDCASGDTFWCEDNIACYTPMFAESSVKHDTSAWAYTYLKDANIVKDNCNVITNQAYCTTTYAGSTYKLVGGTALSANSICACEIYSNQFFKGTEGTKLTIASSFVIPELEHHESNTFTRVRKEGNAAKYGSLDSDYKTFAAGENIALTVSELLSLAGVDDLNAANTVAMEQYPSAVANEFASYRQTGFEVNLDFAWLGSVGDTIPDGSDVELILSVIGVPGYSSKGNNVVYTSTGYPSGSATTYNDRYFRGIKFSFTYGGSVGNFKFFNLVVVATSFTILMSISGTIVSLVAFFLMGYSSTVFSNYGAQKVSIKRLHGKIAAQALIGGQCFIRALDKDGSGDAGLDELTSAFIKQGYKRNNAMSLAAALLASSHEDEEDSGLTALNSMMSGVGNGFSSLTETTEMKKAKSVKELEMSQFSTEEEDVYADVRNESMDIKKFCDLISEEETTLGAAMGFLREHDDALMNKNAKDNGDEEINVI